MLIDAHAHVDRYGDDLETALSEIESESILTISVSMDLPSWKRNREIAARSRLVVPAFGIHPWKAADYVHRLDEITPAVSSAAVIGEIGLDHHFVEDSATYPAQQRVLKFFLGAASEQGKIVNLHTKGAEAAVLQLLSSFGVERAIVHWYAGPPGPFHGLLDRGAFFTIGVGILHSPDARTIAKEIPSDLLLTETDNPGGLEWLTGTPGTPRAINDVVSALADVRGVTSEDIELSVEANFRRLIEGDARLRGALATLTGEPSSTGRVTRAGGRAGPTGDEEGGTE